MRGNLPSYSESEPESTPAPAVLAPVTAVLATVPVVAAPIPAETVHKPKLCRLEKTAAGYGFHLNGIQGVHGQYIKEVGFQK